MITTSMYTKLVFHLICVDILSGVCGIAAGATVNPSAICLNYKDQAWHTKVFLGRSSFCMFISRYWAYASSILKTWPRQVNQRTHLFFELDKYLSGILYLACQSRCRSATHSPSLVWITGVPPILRWLAGLLWLQAASTLQTGPVPLSLDQHGTAET